MSDRDTNESGNDEGTTSSDTDDDRSLFADLLDRIEEQRDRSNWVQREGDSTSQDDDADARTTVDFKPSEIVRERVPEEFPLAASAPEFRLPRAKPSGNKQLYMGIVLGVTLSLILPGAVAVTVGHVTDTVLAPPPGEYVNANDTIYVETGDAMYLSRVFRETTHEVAYCGLITDDRERPRLEVWMANTVNAAPDQIRFITDNCPDEVQEVLLHTHPNGDLRPSEQDVRTLAQRQEQFLCIQGGPLRAEPGTEVENLACYRQLEAPEHGVELARLNIVLAEDSAIIS